MRIKGYEVSELLTIRDTTSGQITIWIMIIMLLSVNILYQLTYLYCAMKKLDQLKNWERLLRKSREEEKGK